MYVATNPSYRLMVSATHLLYEPIVSRRSSGSSRDDSAVEPTRSQNITVSCRRSALSTREVAGTTAGGLAVSSMGLPQPPQNLAVASFSKPQDGQAKGSGVPHSAQKRLVVVFSAMQLGQRIWCPRAKRIR